MRSKQIRAVLGRTMMVGTALVAVTLGGAGAHAAEAEPPKPAAPVLTLALADVPQRVLPRAAAERAPIESSAARPRGFDVTIDFE